jgi:hypothetical protein
MRRRTYVSNWTDGHNDTRARRIQLTHSYATFTLHCPLRLESFCMHFSSKCATCPANQNVLHSITNYEGPTATRLTCINKHTCSAQPLRTHNAAQINRPTMISAFPIPLFVCSTAQQPWRTSVQAHSLRSAGTRGH